MSPDELHTLLYNALCGTPPALRPWHFQWHATHQLHKILTATLAGFGGDVLDLGCGAKPYQSLFRQPVRSYVGADVLDAPTVDVQVTPGEPLPFANASFDVLLSTQLLEHVEDLGQMLSEMYRVLRSGGALVVTVPFLYMLHGAPHDYRRFTEHGLRSLFGTDYTISKVLPVGGIGGTLALHLLAWLFFQSNRTKIGRALRLLLLPVRIMGDFLVNCLGWLLDQCDGTGLFPHELVLVARKR
ncbi:MAG: hypothetical protein CVU73_06505 [Deltaproteobacteria bacterium HGW-Deltaproteobacteria-8]|jgi:SAM-dependent methyltransferase|nr:MAG: hypothetical protein CVU73_06505 [Deltaproteobacteria bacterium HGW-Deltaproteobacteria-8]